VCDIRLTAKLFFALGQKRAAYLPGRVHRAVPADDTDKMGFRRLRLHDQYEGRGAMSEATED
jgi:hypothetical protein